MSKYGYCFRSDALALASPSGHISKAARRAIEKRIDDQLFGPKSGCGPWKGTPSAAEQAESHINGLRSRIATLRSACANQLATGRKNKTTRALDAAQAELAGLLTEERLP